MSFNPKGLATAIGSYPHKDTVKACDLIFETIPEVPIWPQLPNIDFREQMDIQYCEGFPSLVLDSEKQKIYFDTSVDTSEALGNFYEKVLAEDYDYFKITPEFSRGIPAFESYLEKADLSKVKYIKTQIVGPVTFGLGTVDEGKRAVYYNEMFRDVVVKGITMKAKWMVNKFKKFGKDQICFVDEPILSAFGSSTYVSVQRDDVVACLGEVVEALHQDGVLVGTHCCGNTEWSILVDAGVDIINFDAFEFGDTIAHYADKVKTFLEKGGALACGIVPTSEKILNETPKSLFEKLEKVVKNLASKGIDDQLIWNQAMVSPSCGTGSLKLEIAENIFRQLKEVSDLVKSK